MLPAISLQLTDIPALETGAEAPQLLPEQATEPEAAFAGFLALRLDVMTGAEGTDLPEGGNSLPSPEAAAGAVPSLAIEANDDSLTVETAGLAPVPIPATGTLATQSPVPREPRATQPLAAQPGEHGLPTPTKAVTPNPDRVDDGQSRARAVIETAWAVTPPAVETNRSLPVDAIGPLQRWTNST